MVRTFLISLFALSLWGCALFGDEDNTLPPAELLPIADELRLQQVWKKDLGVGNDGLFLRLTPVVDRGRLFAAEHKGRVASFGLDKGERVWLTETKAPVSSAVGVGEGLILVGTADAQVIALDWQDGSERWRATVTSEVLAAPGVQDGVVVVQTVDGNLLGLSAGDGKRLWVYNRSVPVLSLRGTSAPLHVPGAIIAGFASGKMVALDLKRGVPVWEASVGIPSGRSELERMVDIDATPRLAGTVVYGVTYQGRAVALDGRSGEIFWARDFSSFVDFDLDGDNLYLTDADSHVWSMSQNNGASIWKQEELQHRAVSAPVVLGDYVAVGDFEGYVHLLAREDGAVRARVRVDSEGMLARPIVAGDTLYVFGNGGKLAAYRLAE